MKRKASVSNPYPTPTKRRRTISMRSRRSSTSSSAMRDLADAASVVSSAARKRVRRRFKKLKYKKGGAKKSLSGASLKRKVIDKFEKFGVSNKWEANGTIVTQETAAPTYNPTQFAVAGHISLIPRNLMYSLACAMLKSLALRMDIPISGFATPIPNFAAGDVLSIRWQQTVVAVPTNTSLGLAPGNTWLDAAGLLYNILIVTIPEESELLDLNYVPVAASFNKAVYLDLQNSYFKARAKHTLTIQNSSLPADPTDDTADEVDAVHLKGLTVVGKGSGTAILRPRSPYTTDIGLWAQNLDGFITRQYALQTQVLRDIPRPEELINVKKSGKILMQAGAVQQSKLRGYFSGTINYCFKILRDGMDDVNAVKNFKYGSFAIHFLEKVIESNSGTTPITLLCSYDYEVDAYVTTKQIFPTTQTIYNGATQYQ